MPSHIAATCLVTELYRGILQRDPDPDGLAHYVGKLTAGEPLAPILHGFVTSEEFTGTLAPRRVAAPSDLAPALAVDLTLTAAQRRRLWHHIASRWSALGEADPFWSVLSAPDFHLDRMDAPTATQFYQTGANDLARIEGWLARHARALTSATIAAEFGCGVGRLTQWLAPKCSHLHAFDISATHLARAEHHIASHAVSNVTYHLLRDPAQLAQLAGTTLFVSFIVLQHNPPPIIALILDQAFRHLAPGGLALFQVPTYRQDYSFHLAPYLADLTGHERIEMHCLPQPHIFALAARHGLTVLEVQQDILAGDWGISHTFLLGK